MPNKCETITITREDFKDAFCKALTERAVEEPHTMLIQTSILECGVLAMQILFGEYECEGYE